MDLLERVGEKPGWWGWAPLLIDPVSQWVDCGPDPFLRWDQTQEAEWQEWFAQQAAGQREGRRRSAQYSFVRMDSDWKQFRRNASKHPIVPPDSLRPGWIVDSDGFQATESRNPMIHIMEGGRLIAVFGWFVRALVNDQIAPHPNFQPSLPSEATRAVMMELLSELALHLPTRMVPIRIIRVDQSWNLDMDARRWIELPVTGRLVIPTNPPQDKLVEWLSDELDSRRFVSERASRLWLTRRMARRVSRWLWGLKPKEWRTPPPRLEAAIELVECFQFHTADNDFPRFLADHSGAHALCLNLPIDESQKILWRSEIGAVDREHPFMDASLVQAKGREPIGRRLKSRYRDEAVFSLSHFPRERLELRRIIEG